MPDAIDLELHCLRCDYPRCTPGATWKRRTVGRLPVQCPNCKSMAWNKPLKRKTRRQSANPKYNSVWSVGRVSKEIAEGIGTGLPEVGERASSNEDGADNIHDAGRNEESPPVTIQVPNHPAGCACEVCQFIGILKETTT